MMGMKKRPIKYQVGGPVPPQSGMQGQVGAPMAASMGGALGGKRAAMQSTIQDTNQRGALSRAAMGQTQSAMPAANQSSPMRREPGQLRAELQAQAAQGRTRLGPTAQGQSRAALQAGAGIGGLNALRGQMQQAPGGQGAPQAGQGLSEMAAMQQAQSQAGAQQLRGMLQRSQPAQNAMQGTAMQGMTQSPAVPGGAGQLGMQGMQTPAGLTMMKRGGVVGKPPMTKPKGKPMPAFKKGGPVKKAKGGMIGRGCK